MICWMGEKTNEIIDRHNMGVIGFDLERESEDARCIVELGDTLTVIKLGNVKGLTYHAIELRFAAAMLQFAMRAAEDGDEEGYEVLDELLESLNGKE